MRTTKDFTFHFIDAGVAQLTLVSSSNIFHQCNANKSKCETCYQIDYHSLDIQSSINILMSDQKAMNVIDRTVMLESLLRTQFIKF